MACICGETCTDSLCGAYPPKPIPNANGYLVAISGVGAPGSKGDKGDPGEPGPAGPAGADSTVPGPQGPQGPAGADSSVPGPAGPTGPAGPVGAQGPKGDTGSPGATGPVGPQGSVGATGPQGPRGPQGAQGPAGGVGPQGEPGPGGATGSPGPAGPTGVPGPVGPQGPQGIQGPAGLGITYQSTVATVDDLPATAVQGDLYVVETPAPAHGWVWDDVDQAWVDAGPVQGPQGVPGEVGPEGAVGPVGPAGPVGDAGPVGPAGAQGPQGDPGPAGADSVVPGPAGPAGEAGPAGPAGADGAQGPAGVEGPAGPVGPAGPAGADSTVPGPVGPVGPQGEPGADGAVGPAGPTAVSADANNTSVLGSDGLIFTPAAAVATGFLPTTGGEMTGAIVLPSGITAMSVKGTSYNMLGGSGGVAFRSNTSNIINHTAAEVVAFVPITTSGGAVGVRFGSGGPSLSKSGTSIAASAPITVSPAPTAPEQLANKAYVDAQISSGALVGPEGPAGPEGPQGVQGEQGVQGPAGLGIQFKGEVPTYADLPTTGQVQGDLWTVASPTPAHGWAWDAATSSWVDAGQIQGPQGIQGVQGVAGPVGPAGAKGDTGPAGPTGATGPIGPEGPQGPAGEGASYTLPVATATVLGGVKVGSGLTINASTGVLTANAAGTYLNKGGDNMTGPLRFTTTTTGSGFNGTDVYMYYDGTYFRCVMPDGGKQGWLVDTEGMTQFPNAVPKCAIAPTDTGHLTNKAYVDGAISGSTVFLKLSGGTMTGTITTPTTVPALTFGTSGYNVFGASGGVAVRSNTTNIVNVTASEIVAYKPITTAGTGVGVRFGSSGPSLSKSGTSIASSAPITVDAAPAAANELANKAYVDSKGGVANPVAGSKAGLTLWTGTQAEYDAIATKNGNTVYAVV
jgi:hypothetical protein